MYKLNKANFDLNRATYWRLFLVNIALATPKCVETLFVVVKWRTNSLVMLGLVSWMAWAISSWVRPAAAVRSRDNCSWGWMGESTKFPTAEGSLDPCKTQFILSVKKSEIYNQPGKELQTFLREYVEKEYLEQCPRKVSNVVKLIIGISACDYWGIGNSYSCWSRQ